MNKCSFKIYSEKTNIAIIYDKDMFKTCFYVYHIALFHQITLHQEKKNNIANCNYPQVSIKTRI